MQSLLQHLQYALRQLRKSPGFTFTVVLTLALGIGANAAVFTLFDQALLRMLPVVQPRQLVRFEWTGPFNGSASSFGGTIQNYFSYPMYKDLRDKNQVFSDILAADRANVGVTWNNQAEDEDVEIVSGNYFQLLGIQPALGRLLTPQDDTAKGANPQLVLSYAYWKSHFAGSPAVINQTVRINGNPFTIVGVAPEGFQTAIGGFKPGIFLPISMSDVAMPWRAPLDDLNNHQVIWLTLIGRLKPGMSLQQAEAGLAPLWHSLRVQELTLYKNPTERFSKRFVESQLQVKDDSRGFSPGRLELKTPLILLMSMAGLLVAMCAINVATLLLLRASARAREMSMRYALGATRSRVVTQLFVEGGLLGLAGASVGLAFAPLISGALVRLMTRADPGSEPYSASIDARILFFTIGVSILVSLLFSLAPVLHFLNPDLAGTLRQSAGTASKSSQRFRKTAVGVQIALSVLLLGGAGLFVRTLDNLRRQPVGFDTTRLVTFNVDPSSSGYKEDRNAPIVTNVLEAVRRIPGVSSAAATTDAELASDTNTTGFNVEGHTFSEEEKRDFEAPAVTPGYFATLRQPLLAGREFTAADVKGSTKVAVVNLAFAKQFFGSPQNALGRQIGDQGTGSDVKLDTTIVGVVGNTHHTDLRTELGAAVYQPYLQINHPTGVQVYVQTTQSPELVQSSIRKAVHDLDPTLVADGLRTMEAQTAIISSGERALAILAVGFSILALVLAAVGLYGVLAYSIEQRTREIGVRLALGAPRASIVVTVLREMVIIAAIATLVALPCIGLLARYFRSQLFGVTVYDPVTLAAATALIALMVLMAAALPARRAAGVQPMQALRTE